MPHSKNNSAFHFFLYLLMFFSLGFVIFPLGIIAFQFINKFLPEVVPSAGGIFDQGAVKFAIAAIFIAGPVFFTASKLVRGQLFSGKMSDDSRVRRWLTYIVMFFAAGTIIGDLIALIVNFLEGDIAGKFLLKILVILILAGGIFGYYFWDMSLRKMEGKKYKENQIAFWSFLAVVLIAFVSAFFIIDSPAVSREKKIDQQMLTDIQSLDSSVLGYYNKTGILPDNLSQLKNTEFYLVVKNADLIIYKKVSEKNYQFCGRFILPGPDQQDVDIDTFGSLGDWKHDAGQACFDRIAVPKNSEKPLL